MFDDVSDVSQGQDVVVPDGMVPGVESYQVAIDLVSGAARELRLVVGFESDDVKAITADRDGARVLGGDGEPLGYLARGHVDHGNGVFRREGHVSFVVSSKSNAYRLVKASCLCF